MRTADDEARRAWLLEAWRSMDEPQRFAWNKLLTGEFRVGVSQSLVVHALAELSGAPQEDIAHRLMGEWQPDASFWRSLIAPEGGPTVSEAGIGRPYPFCLAYPLEGKVEDLGDIREWQVEWKWDGIRAQLIRRGGRTFLWSRGEELISDRFPEVQAVGPLKTLAGNAAAAADTPSRRFLIVTELNDASKVVLRQAGVSSGP